MKIAICDDNPEDRACLERHCKALGCHQPVIFTSGEELLQYPDFSSVNLLFLDIEMPGIDGIEVKKQLEIHYPSTFIAFCTSHSENVYDAYGRNVISFITKPYDEHSIEHTIKNAARLSCDFFPVMIDRKTIIPCRDIVSLQAENKYTVFYTTDGKTYSTKKSLTAWIKELQDLGFCAVSRSAAINLKYYEKMQDQTVILRKGRPIPISRKLKHEIEQKFISYMLQKKSAE